MPHLWTYRVPLFNSMFYYRNATVAEAELNSKSDCKTTPAAKSRGGVQEYVYFIHMCASSPDS